MNIMLKRKISIIPTLKFGMIYYKVATFIVLTIIHVPGGWIYPDI